MDVQLLAQCGRRILVFLVALLTLLGCVGPAELRAGPADDHSDLVLVDRDGETHQLGEEGVVLLFWQPWCKACREEAPRALDASRTLAGTMRFFGIVSGPPDVVDEAQVDQGIAELGLTYPQVRDEDLALTTRFGVHTIPTVVVLDANGRLRYRGSHLPADWTTVR